jgi:hypothetical protein
MSRTLAVDQTLHRRGAHDKEWHLFSGIQLPLSGREQVLSKHTDTNSESLSRRQKFVYLQPILTSQSTLAFDVLIPAHKNQLIVYHTYHLADDQKMYWSPQGMHSPYLSPETVCLFALPTL